MREKIFIIQSRPNSSRVGHNVLFRHSASYHGQYFAHTAEPMVHLKSDLDAECKRGALHVCQKRSLSINGRRSQLKKHHQIRAKERDDTNMKEQLCQLIIYVYNTSIIPLRRCGNVRSEKLMLTVLRGQAARNTPR